MHKLLKVSFIVLVCISSFLAGAYVDSIYQAKYFPRVVNHNNISGNKIKRSQGEFKPNQEIGASGDTVYVDTLKQKKRFRLFRKKNRG